MTITGGDWRQYVYYTVPLSCRFLSACTFFSVEMYGMMWSSTVTEIKSTGAVGKQLVNIKLFQTIGAYGSEKII